MPLRPKPSTAAGPKESALPVRHFTVLCLAMITVLRAESLVDAAAEIQLHPGYITCLALTVAALFNWAILSLYFMVLASRVRGAAESELVKVLRSTTAAAAALTRFLMRSWLPPPFTVLCLAMGVALHAQPLVAAAAELRVHQGLVVLGVAALFYRAKLHVLQGRVRAAVAAPTSSASGHPLEHFVVLCLILGALPHVEPLMAADAELHIHPGIVACFLFAATALFNWAILSIHFRVARRAAEREIEMLPRPAAPGPSAERYIHVTLLIVAALMSASWFTEPFEAAAELQLHRPVIITILLLLAALFNLSVLLLHSFLPDPPSAAAAHGHGVGAITAGVMGIGMATAACLVGAGGSAYRVSAPARG